MKRRASSESGYALLFVYAMAATIAIMLLREIPRVAFEAQRDKEQLLIDRGEQYTRGIQLFVRKFNRFPADLDALKSTQNLRFLRREYVDPMTGKNEWRIIHAGPGGVLTDSLITVKKDDKKIEQQNFITEIQQTGGNQADGNQNVNIGTRQRQSEQAGAPGDPNNPAPPPQQQFDATGQPIQPSQNPPNGNIQAGAPGQFQPGAGAIPPGAQFPGGVPGQPQFGQPQNGPPTAAGNLINQILTTPRPGGLNGLGGVQQVTTNDPNAQGTGANFGPGTNSITSSGTSSGTGGATVAAPVAAAAPTIGGGIAGVASKREENGIKVYKDQKSYHKWEFVYDITKDTSRTGGGAVPQGAPPPGTPIGTPIGTPTPAPNGAPQGTPPAINNPTPPAPAPVTSP